MIVLFISTMSSSARTNMRMSMSMHVDDLRRCVRAAIHSAANLPTYLLVMGASQPFVSLNEVHTLPPTTTDHTQSLIIIITTTSHIDNKLNSYPHLRPGQERYNGGEEAASFYSVRSCSVLFCSMIERYARLAHSELIK